ncbi:putative cytochrome P450 [Gordonia effusa NBRC 100432]|uniref:Putative cytochrome P450 n=1 Tax=Gordonia effusa NBRC 100432 TaxID=1077974 RepID=H0R2E4_9ACTN|nr:cytochrome P450 [Gordonia effusa]GAB19245.1 putative cytochrome P450 [Gordonia effusa NBRC 100432]
MTDIAELPTARPDAVRFDDVNRAWIISGYHEARAVLTGTGWSSDPLASQANRDAAAEIGLTESPLAQTMLLLDGPEHTRVRNSLRDVFTPSYIAQLRPAIESIAGDIVDSVPADEPFDFMTQLAQPFPVTVISEWLGLDLETATTLLREAPKLIRALDTVLDPTTIADTAASFTSLVAEFLPLAALRRAEPQDDLLSLLATDPALTLDEVVVNAILLAIAGHETTANLLGGAVVRLFGRTGHRRPIDDLDVDDPRIVTELLRLDGPAQSLMRVATQSHTINEYVISPGDTVVIEIAAANRDPGVFEEPERFRVDRSRRAPHLSFGFGAHRCIGAALAQLEITVALQLLLQRDAEVVGNPEMRDSIILRGLTSVPMVFHKGATR